MPSNDVLTLKGESFWRNYGNYVVNQNVKKWLTKEYIFYKEFEKENISFSLLQLSVENQFRMYGN